MHGHINLLLEEAVARVANEDIWYPWQVVTLRVICFLIFVKSLIQRTQMSFLGITKGEAFEDLVKLLLGPNVVDISANERLVAIRNEFLRPGNSWSSPKERLSTWTTLLQEWHAASWASSCCLLDKCFEQMSLLLNMLRVNFLTWKCKILLDLDLCWIWILPLWLPLHR